MKDAVPGRSSEWVWQNLLLIALVAVAVAVGFRYSLRPGYSPDEELTWLIVDSIARDYVPRLPSGVLYLRGMLHSYLTAVAGAVFGYDLTVYRFVSVAFGALNVLLACAIGRQLHRPAWGLAFAAMVACSPVHGAISAFARFYSPFGTWFLLGLLTFIRTHQGTGSPWPFLAAIAAARLTHELGVVLALLPWLATLSHTDSAARRRFSMLGLQAALLMGVLYATLAIPQRLSLGLVFANVPERVSFEMMPSLILPPMLVGHVSLLSWCVVAAVFGLAGLALGRRSRAGSAWTAILVALALFFQVGPLLVAGVIAAVAQPARATAIAVATALLAGLALIVWPLCLLLATDAALTPAMFLAIARSSFAIPANGWQQFTSVFPWSTWLAAGAIAIATSAHAGRIEPAYRPILLFGVLLFALVAVADVDFRGRYAAATYFVLLLFASDLVARLAEFWTAPASDRPSVITSVLAVALGLASLGEFHRLVPAGARLRAAHAAVASAFVPTYVQVAPAHVRSLVDPQGLTLCTDETACRYLLGRCDYWLVDAIEAFPSAIVDASGMPRGLYGGAPVILSEQIVSKLSELRKQSTVTVLIVDAGKFPAPLSAARIRKAAVGAPMHTESGVTVVRLPRVEAPGG